jgi:hypothetical protein
MFIRPYILHLVSRLINQYFGIWSNVRPDPNFQLPAESLTGSDLAPKNQAASHHRLNR